MAVIGTAEIDVVAKTSNFDKDIKAKVGSASKAFDGLDRSVGRLEGGLRKLGLTSQDVAIIMGAGLAGGAAFALREVLQFAGASVEAASALEEQRSATDALFDSNSELIRSFAESAEALGFSERAALQATNTFGGFFQNIGLADEAAANLGVGFVALAADISSLMDIPVEDVQTRLISGLRGEQDAVERLNISINEKAVADRAMTDSGKDSVEQLTQGERVLARAKIIFEQTSKAQGDLARTSDTLANTQRRVNAEFENAKADLGQGLKPVVTTLTQGFSDMLFFLNEGIERLKGLSVETEEPTTRLGALSQRLREFFTQPLPTSFKGLLEDFGLIDKAEEDAASTAEELAAAFAELEEQANQDAVAIGKMEDATESLADAQKKLNDVLRDAEVREDRAERSLFRALQDAELAQDEAERDRAEAIEDRAEAIADAQQRVVDVQLQGNRDVRSARERLDDFERDSQRRQSDGLRRIIDLEKARARAILGATLDVQQAQIAGDAEAENRARLALKDAKDTTAIADAKRGLAREEADQALEQERLERDLAEAREDRKRERLEAIAAVAQAQEDADERIADADRRLADVERDNRRSVEDAQRALDEARREGTEAVAEQTEKVDELTRALRRQRRQVQGLTEDLNLLRDAGNANLPGMVDENGNILFNAEGGLIPGGRASIVGELGPELIIPNSNTTVVSNQQVLEALKGIGTHATGPSVVIQTGNTDPRVLANEIAYRLAQDVVT